MRSRTSNLLKRALQERLLVKFSRPSEAGSFSGYVVNVGEKFFMIAVVDDRIRFDGFACLRLADVRHLEVPHKYAKVAEIALKKRGERMPKMPRVEIGRIEDLLRSANRAFPLITIFREKVDPDLCWIGRVVDVNNGRVSFLEIGPDAAWEPKSKEYKVSEITRVDFGNDYEKALMLVANS